MASQNHIWSPYGVSINQDPFYDDGNSPEESFQNLMTQFSQHLDGKRVYILEKIGPDSFIMTYEWKVSAVSEREMHQVFTTSQIEARFPPYLDTRGRRDGKGLCGPFEASWQHHWHHRV